MFRLVQKVGSVGRVAGVAVVTGVAYTTTTTTHTEGSVVPLAVAAAAVGYSKYSSNSLEARLASLEAKAAKAESSAFVFIKPHAVTGAVESVVKHKFESMGISVVAEGVIGGPDIDQKMLIDTHYGAIAAKAVKLKPSELEPSAKAQAQFEKAFGLKWTDALKAGKVYNAADGCATLGINGDELDAKWATLKRGVNLIKFGGGFYCGQVDGIWIINGFYMSMRGKFTDPKAQIHYYLVEWPTSKLAWADFRNNVLGGTNPGEAAPGSIRRTVYDDWKKLGLAAEPDTGDNGVHASASPFEALAERLNWCGATVETDTFGKGMLASGISKHTILQWANDPMVQLGDGTKASLFDSLEDLSADMCLNKAAAIDKANK